MIEFIHTAPLFQLAFGLNAVFGYWGWELIKTRFEILELFKDQLVKFGIDSNSDEAELAQALLNKLEDFNSILSLGLKVVLLALVSVLLCFFCLVFSAVYPDAQVQAWVFICSALWLVVVNPTVYFIFKLRYKRVTPHTKLLLQSLQIDELKEILHEAQGIAMLRMFKFLFMR